MWRHRALVYPTIYALTLLAALLRFPCLDRLPPGLYHDEAYNGLDAIAINEGHHAIFFPANNGREPLYIYLVSLTIRVFGRTPVGIRAASAVLGTLLVPLIFVLGREMFDKHVGLWAALLATPHMWLLCLSRTGFRAGSLAVVVAAGLAILWRAQKTHNWRWFALSGVLLGLTQYTYVAARFVPIALGLGLLLTKRCWQGLGRHLLLLLVCMALIVLPLAIYALNNPEAFLARPRQVSVFNSAVHQGRPIALLAGQTVRYLQAFFFLGDVNPRHNVPGRPMLDLCASLLSIVGLVVGLTSRAKPQMTFALAWIAVMLLPGILAQGEISFLRLVGVLPLLLYVPAVGATWLWRRLSHIRVRAAALALPALVLAFGGWNVWTYYTYFAHATPPLYYFEVPSTEIAAHANRFLGRGYVRNDLPLPPASSGWPRRVYVADELLHFSTTVTFLLQPDPRVHSLSEAPTADFAQEERLLLLLPTDVARYLPLLPPRRQIEAHLGSMMQGELPGDQPFLLYVTFTATRPPEIAPLAQFEDGIALLDYRLERPDLTTLEVWLRWRATSAPTRAYTVFVHLLQAGRFVGQHDGPPAEGLYPTNLWREGDVIVDVHRLTLSPGAATAGSILEVGLYRPEDLTRLRCTTADGQVLDKVPLAVIE